MEKKKISFDLFVYDNMNDLQEEDALLMQAAVAARKNAYAPYSNFKVGAAVRLENGEIIIGNNQENASFPVGICAEGVAISQAGAKFPNVKIESIAVASASRNYEVKKPAAPCGICRQSISEYESRQKSPITIIMMGETGSIFKCDSITDILPLSFNGSFL